MSTRTEQEILAAAGIEYRHTKSGKYATSCPKCGSGYFSVLIDDEGVRGHCASCGAGGGLLFDSKSDDFFKEKKKTGSGAMPPIKEVYQYTDKDGGPAFQVVRFDTDDPERRFRQRRDERTWSLKGCKIVPFKLHLLVRGIAEGRTIYIVEGEKDVLTLRKHGYAATCNAMGAGKWRDEWGKIFDGADVVIIGDHDEPGRRHVQDVARKLKDHAQRIRVLDLATIWPEIKVSQDISDWFEAGGTLEKLCGAVEALEPWQDTNGRDEEPPWEDEKPKRKRRAKGSGKGNGHADLSTAAMEIARLALLPEIQYEYERDATAKKLGLRPARLTHFVEMERRKNGADPLQGLPVEFPEPEAWPEEVNGAKLLEEISAGIRHYVVLPDYAADAVALWSVHTHLVQCFQVTPRLGIRSPEKGCGKTTLISALALIVARPLETAGASASVLFRSISKYKPTFLLDECDKWLAGKDIDKELVQVVNSGHRRGGIGIMRNVGDDHEPRNFPTYGAMAISLIGKLPPDLYDRSIAIELQRRLQSEAIGSLRAGRRCELDDLARKIVRWVEDNEEEIDGREPRLPARAINRLADNWAPLFAIAEVAGGDWWERANRAFEAISRTEESTGAMLLEDIKAIFAERSGDRITSEVLVQDLAALEGRPWADWRKGKAMTVNNLARALKPFGVTSETIRVGAETAKGYRLAAFTNAFERYLPPSPLSEPSQRNKCDEQGTSCTFQNVTPDLDVTDRKCEKSNNDGLCYGVTDQIPWEEEHVPLQQAAEPEPDIKDTLPPTVTLPDATDGPHRCSHCGGGKEDGSPIVYVALEDRAGYVHARCEAAWLSGNSGIPFMITNAMRGKLRERRYSDAEILNLTPQQAYDILNSS
jgi:hypothetical protein